MDATYFDTSKLNCDFPLKELFVVPAGAIDNKYSSHYCIISLESLKELQDMVKEVKTEHSVKQWRNKTMYALDDLKAKITIYSAEELLGIKNSNTEEYSIWNNNVLLYYLLRAELLKRNGKTIKKYRVPLASLRSVNDPIEQVNIIKMMNQN